MSVGTSGRIVIEVPPGLKREIYDALMSRGITLKDWFLHQAHSLLECPENPGFVPPNPPIKAAHEMTKKKLGACRQGEGGVPVDDDLIISEARPVLNSSTEAILRTYTKLEARFHVQTLSSDVSYRSPVNFVESMEHPRHRWFPYKEGFSPGFVRGFIEEFRGDEGGLVLDPFSGVGTTALVAAGMGISSAGFDVSPMASFIARTKAIQLDQNDMRRLARFINDVACLKDGEVIPAEAPRNSTVTSYFEGPFLDALLTMKALVNHHSDQRIVDLGRLAFLSLVERYSTHRRAGNGVKRKTRIDYGYSGLTPLEEVKLAFTSALKVIHDDLETHPLSHTPKFHEGSCLDEASWADLDTISVALTSPPYPNCFDYSKIYLRELWLGDFFLSKEDQSRFREVSIRSHVHASWEDRHQVHGSELVETLIRPYLCNQGLWSNRIPEMVSGYFKDMGALLKRIHPRLSRGGTFGLVVGNSVYGGLPIATDLILGEIAESIGFEVLRIDVYRAFVPSSQQCVSLPDMAWVRESMVILRKQ